MEDCDDFNDGNWFGSWSFDQTCESILIEYNDPGGCLNDCTEEQLGASELDLYMDLCEDCLNNENYNCDEFFACEGEMDECGVCDGDGSSCNQPIANNLQVQVYEDSTVVFDLLVSDPNDDILSVNVSDDTNNGTLNITGINVSYTPELDFFGIDEFTFTVTDGVWVSSSATVTIEVIAVNDAPTASNRVVDASSGTIQIDFNDFVGDVDTEDSGTLEIISIPPSTTTILETLNEGKLIPAGYLTYDYTLPLGVDGLPIDIDYLIYKVFDDTDNSASGVITFTSSRWMESDNLRFPPDALNDDISMQEDGVKIVEFLGFDP